MRRMAILALAIMALALLTGCPFESDVPLGAPGPGSLDPKLLGAWTSTDETGSVADVEFIPFNKYEYYVELREEGKGQPERYRAYTVKVGDQPFLNISELKQETAPATFYFARYSVSKEGVLALHLVGDQGIPKDLAKDQKALVKFVAAHLKGTVLDDSERPVLMRRPAPDSKPAAGKAPSKP